MSAQTETYYEIVSQLPADTVVTFHGVGWEEYEELIEQVGEASALRISFDNGTLQVMTVSPEHERYTRFIDRLVGTLSVRLRLNVLFYGSTTMRRKIRGKGNEPDACFYVQNAAAIGNRMQIDFDVDPPPDIVVEVDIHHDTRNKFPIYAALCVPEVWRFDGDQFTIHLLEHDDYRQAQSSAALPMLTSRLMTEQLKKLETDGELLTILAFEQWLGGLRKE
jgi:Uma2 family endonuclease